MPRIPSVLAGLALAASLAAAPVTAQDRDSRFTSYETYAEFVDTHIRARKFKALILRLGGRDEYTIDQLNQIQGQFVDIYSRDFTDSAVLKEETLGPGFKTEVRAHWGPSGYVWYTAFLHETRTELVVINFRLNSNAPEVLGAY